MSNPFPQQGTPEYDEALAYHQSPAGKAAADKVMKAGSGQSGLIGASALAPKSVSTTSWTAAQAARNVPREVSRGAVQSSNPRGIASLLGMSPVSAQRASMGAPGILTGLTDAIPEGKKGYGRLPDGRLTSQYLANIDERAPQMSVGVSTRQGLLGDRRTGEWGELGRPDRTTALRQMQVPARTPGGVAGSRTPGDIGDFRTPEESTMYARNADVGAELKSVASPSVTSKKKASKLPDLGMRGADRFGSANVPPPAPGPVTERKVGPGGIAELDALSQRGKAEQKQRDTDVVRNANKGYNERLAAKQSKKPS